MEDKTLWVTEKKSDTKAATEVVTEALQSNQKSKLENNPLALYEHVDTLTVTCHFFPNVSKIKFFLSSKMTPNKKVLGKKNDFLYASSPQERIFDPKMKTS